MFSIFISRCGLSPVLMLYLILTLPQEAEEVQQRMKKCHRQWSGKGHLAQSGIPLSWQVCSQCCTTETSTLLYLILNAFFSKQCLLNHILSSTDYFFSSCRGMVDASGDQFVAYFLPSKETIRKRKRDQEGETEYMEEEEWVLLH